MWGGRFAEGPSAIMQEINASIGVDKRMWQEDIAGSRAHAAMLGAVGVISAEDAAAIDAGLAEIAGEWATGPIEENLALEDIHMHVEARLKEKIGDVAGRLHTARSRNDQVATDLRLWVRGAIDRLDTGLAAFQDALLTRADEHAGTVMPGFTHLQTAQPVTLGHHLMAYAEMAKRDRGRFQDARKRLNECPLGAAALAGTGFAIDRNMTATALGFDRPTANSLDSVSDRDFAIEFMTSCLQAGLHLSRLAEEIIIWASQPLWVRETAGRLFHGFVDHAAKAQSRRRRAGTGQDGPVPGRTDAAGDGDEGASAWPIPRTCRRTRHRFSTPMTRWRWRWRR